MRDCCAALAHLSQNMLPNGNELPSIVEKPTPLANRTTFSRLTIGQKYDHVRKKAAYSLRVVSSKLVEKLKAPSALGSVKAERQ